MSVSSLLLGLRNGKLSRAAATAPHSRPLVPRATRSTNLVRHSIVAESHVVQASRSSQLLNVAATLALFFALGGTAYAAATIGSADIVNNSIRSEDIHNGTISNKDLQPGIRVPKLFGNFNGTNGAKTRGRGISSSERMGLGFYVVHFRREHQQLRRPLSDSEQRQHQPGQRNDRNGHLGQPRRVRAHQRRLRGHEGGRRLLSVSGLLAAW